MSKLDFSVYREQMRSLRGPDGLEDRVRERLAKEAATQEERPASDAGAARPKVPRHRANVPSPWLRRVALPLAASCVLLAGIGAVVVSHLPTPEGTDGAEAPTAIEITGMPDADRAAGAADPSQRVIIATQLIFRPHIIEGEDGNGAWSAGTLVLEVPASVKRMPQVIAHDVTGWHIEPALDSEEGTGETHELHYEVVALNVDTSSGDEGAFKQAEQELLIAVASAEFEITTANASYGYTCDEAALAEVAATLKDSPSDHADRSFAVPLIPLY